MSLKFGIYLVEQKIISPEQFCGLVKIQQETVMSLANIALRKNMLTIKQVANILDKLEFAPSKSFEQIAVDLDLLDTGDAAQLLRYQQASCSSIRRLASECGLLTERQSAVLYNHFDRIQGTLPDASTTPAYEPKPTAPFPQPVKRARPPAPKFKNRPVIMRPYSTS